MSVMFLNRPGKPALAYRKLLAKATEYPSLVFLSGFASDMEGTKASYLAERCGERGQGYVRFDYSGHGASEGVFADGTIGAWKNDALDVIDTLTDGPLVLVGSSMGGWIGLLCALARKDRVTGFIGLAAAPDFTRDIPARLTTAQKALMDAQGYIPLPATYGDNPPPLTKKLLEEGEAHCLLDGPVDIQCPVRLVQGMKDSEVPWQTAEAITKAITGTDKDVYLREEGDHRLSTPDDLALLDRLVLEVSKKKN